jgi:hypothetical protein
MTQAQPQAKTPPPLPAAAPSTEGDNRIAADTDITDEWQDADASSEEPEPLPREAPPRVLAAVRAPYRPSEDNVYPLDSARPGHTLWRQHELSPYAGMEQRRGRPRHARRPRPAPVKQVAAKKRYRTGHFIAALFALMGWLLAAGGLAASLLTIFEPELSLRLGSPNLMSSGGAALGGLLTVALAVAAKAHFDFAHARVDSANVQREMMAMAIQQQRARFGAEPY